MLSARALAYPRAAQINLERCYPQCFEAVPGRRGLGCSPEQPGRLSTSDVRGKIAMSERATTRLVGCLLCGLVTGMLLLNAISRF